MASEWCEPYASMWSIASSMLVDYLDRQDEREVLAVPVVLHRGRRVGDQGERPLAPRGSRRRLALRARVTRGRNSAATFSWTSSVSKAQQTEHRLVLALTTIASALSRSASAST